MIRLIKTLMRGTAARAEEGLADRHALLVLEQQIRDAAAEVERGKRSLALAVAREDAERKRILGLRARASDLEARAVEALAAGRDALASEAAASIADIENEHDAGSAALASFSAEVARLRDAVNASMRRLAELNRGRRVAEVADAAGRLREVRARSVDPGALAAAESTLRRLRARQAEEVVADAALSAINAASSPGDVAERLAAEGFGPGAVVTGGQVLARLRKQVPAAGAVDA